jgi:hypothetical protein
MKSSALGLFYYYVFTLIREYLRFQGKNTIFSKSFLPHRQSFPIVNSLGERKSILDEPMLDDATQDAPINNRKWTQASDNAIAITGTPNQRSRCAAERLHHRRWRCPSYTKRRSSSSSEK